MRVCAASASIPCAHACAAPGDGIEALFSSVFESVGHATQHGVPPAVDAPRFTQRNIDEITRCAPASVRRALYPARRLDALSVQSLVPCVGGCHQDIRSARGRRVLRRSHPHHSITSARDAYARLDVPRDATRAAINTAYKRLATRVHPDKNRAPGSTEAFRLLVAARTQALAAARK